MDPYDLVVIGSGAAGQSAAATAVHLGASRVAIVEGRTLWGTCVNVGCIPSKFLLALADMQFYGNYHHAGITTVSRFDLPLALGRKKSLIDRLKQAKQDRLIDTLHVELVQGMAQFRSPDELVAGERLIRGKKFIIATGSFPTIPRIEGLGAVPYLTSTEALSPDHIPGSLIVVGGRALGLEFAQLFSHLGTWVTLLQRSPKIIPEEEPEVSGLMTEYLTAEGIGIRTGVEIRGVRKTGEGVTISATIAGADRDFSAEQLLLATGRTPDTATLRLDLAGVKTGKDGTVLVDSTLKTSAPHIWAAGDVTGEPMLETSARFGGEVAAMNALSGQVRPFDRQVLPHGIYTTPQVAGVGLTEERAVREGILPMTRCFRMDRLAKTSIAGDPRGLVKIVAESGTGRIVGIHICAPLATEMILAGVLAVKSRLTVSELADTMPAFPTAAESLVQCARAFRGTHTGCGG
jgi:mercuric reductase